MKKEGGKKKKRRKRRERRSTPGMTESASRRKRPCYLATGYRE